MSVEVTPRDYLGFRRKPVQSIRDDSNPQTHDLCLIPLRMSLSLSLSLCLSYTGPFNNPVTSHLKLRNPHHKPIVVKIKVTSPKAYCVRPNSSRIEPGESLEIAGEHERKRRRGRFFLSLLDCS